MSINKQTHVYRENRTPWKLDKICYNTDYWFISLLLLFTLLFHYYSIISL